MKAMRFFAIMARISFWLAFATVFYYRVDFYTGYAIFVFLLSMYYMCRRYMLSLIWQKGKIPWKINNKIEVSNTFQIVSVPVYLVLTLPFQHVDLLFDVKAIFFVQVLGIIFLCAFWVLSQRSFDIVQNELEKNGCLSKAVEYAS